MVRAAKVAQSGTINRRQLVPPGSPLEAPLPLGGHAPQAGRANQILQKAPTALKAQASPRNAMLGRPSMPTGTAPATVTRFTTR